MLAAKYRIPFGLWGLLYWYCYCYCFSSFTWNLRWFHIFPFWKMASKHVQFLKIQSSLRRRSKYQTTGEIWMTNYLKWFQCTNFPFACMSTCLNMRLLGSCDTSAVSHVLCTRLEFCCSRSVVYMSIDVRIFWRLCERSHYNSFDPSITPTSKNAKIANHLVNSDDNKNNNLLWIKKDKYWSNISSNTKGSLNSFWTLKLYTLHIYNMLLFGSSNGLNTCWVSLPRLHLAWLHFTHSK